MVTYISLYGLSQYAMIRGLGLVIRHISYSSFDTWNKTNERTLMIIRLYNMRAWYSHCRESWPRFIVSVRSNLRAPTSFGTKSVSWSISVRVSCWPRTNRDTQITLVFSCRHYALDRTFSSKVFESIESICSDGSKNAKSQLSKTSHMDHACEPWLVNQNH